MTDFLWNSKVAVSMCKSVYYFPFQLLLPRFGQISETEIEKIKIETLSLWIETIQRTWLSQQYLQTGSSPATLKLYKTVSNNNVYTYVKFWIRPIKNFFITCFSA